MSADKSTQAKELFASGYNCAQAVFLAFNDDLGLDVAQAARLTNCLGGGLGQTGGVCGALSAACLVISETHGRETSDRSGVQGERQQQTYRLVGELYQQFTDAYGSALCPALLERGRADSGGVNEKFNCPAYVGMAAAAAETLTA